MIAGLNVLATPPAQQQRRGPMSTLKACPTGTNASWQGYQPEEKGGVVVVCPRCLRGVVGATQAYHRPIILGMQSAPDRG